ncbi:MAG: hypothetical protein K0Q66_1254 [Chitinophagaceae bacterium]|nr:hypothetical protein [Chitinophagaceae bacterium]
MNKRLLFFTLILVAVTTLCKYFTAAELNWSGISPVFAIGLFSGLLISDKSRSFLLPLLAVFISDMIIEGLYQLGEFDFRGFYTWQLFNYALLAGTALIGWALKGKNYGSLLFGAFAAPTLFFILSNFGAWYIDTFNIYPDTLAGLQASYAAGLPFYGRSLMATLVFLPMILVCYNYLVKRTTALKLA